eukprot:COSAG03_NODE_1437_length_4080_cov_2.349410_6_plen_91_part_00
MGEAVNASLGCRDDGCGSGTLGGPHMTAVPRDTILQWDGTKGIGALPSDFKGFSNGTRRELTSLHIASRRPDDTDGDELPRCSQLHLLPQ